MIRERCMDYMVQNRDHYAEFVTEDFDAYIARKRSETAMGNHLEMQAMSEMFNRNIEVYAYSTEPINTFLAAGASEAPIRVAYHNNAHYNAIVDPHFSTFGVGLGFSDLRPGEAEAKQIEAAVTASEAQLAEQTMAADAIRQSEEAAMMAQIEQAIMRESREQYYNSFRP